VASSNVITDLADRIRALEADDPANYLPALGTGWRRIFARVQPHESPWATLAYEPDDGGVAVSAWSTQTVELFEAGTAGTSAIPHRAGDLVITPIADDVNLPGLRHISDGPGAFSLLRYRPHRRCTLRAVHDTGAYVVKVLADDRGEQFHRDACELWRAAQRDELGFTVAQPFRWEGATRSVWQGIVPGVPVAPTVLGSDGPSLAHRMGAALGDLARSKVQPSATYTSADQLRRTRRAVDQAIRRVPELAADLHRLLDSFETRHGQLSPDNLAPVHGAPHMHQWLIDDDDQLGLIDFDRFALGEIELDIATLLVELDYEEELSQPFASIEDAVVGGYRSTGVEVDRARLQLYSAHKRMSKVTREAWALRTNGERRARRHLARIEADLQW
jgi:aminoglycoside phosphotransferase (APT) family kinase protein